MQPCARRSGLPRRARRSTSGTQADSGKAKRIRREGRIRIAPCTASGAPLGEWIEARAQADASSEALAHVQALMRRKYGLAFLFFRFLGRGRAYTALALRPQTADRSRRFDY